MELSEKPELYCGEAAWGRVRERDTPSWRGRKVLKCAYLEMHSCAFSVTKSVFWEAPYT